MSLKKKTRQVAIIGGGFSGLATAYYLSQKGYQIRIYEKDPIGENASGISAGLLHYYTGPRAKPSMEGEAMLRSTLQLLETASNALNDPVYDKTGLLRPALNQEQAQFFQDTSTRNSTVSWLTADQVKERFAPLYPFSGIWIENGYQIDTKKYLKGLWKACEHFGAEWIIKNIESTDNLHEDLIIIATGAAPLKELDSLPIHPIKGQILEIEWNHTLPFPISAHIYLVPGSKNNRCFVGGTFEHRFTDKKPNEEIAKNLLIPKLYHLCSPIESLKVIGCKAAIRASTPTRKPIFKQMNFRTWALVGMGSKGLLNHAYYASQLCREIENSFS